MREIASAKPGDPPNAVALRQCEMKEPGGALKHATPVLLHHICQAEYETTRNAGGFEFPVHVCYACVVRHSRRKI